MEAARKTEGIVMRQHCKLGKEQGITTGKRTNLSHRLNNVTTKKLE